jgi:hypothetical protein
MAVVNRSSTAITNADSTPPVFNTAGLGLGQCVGLQAYIANAADDSATSVHRIARVPSNFRIADITLTTADATTAGAIDIGLYDIPSVNGGAVVEVDLFTDGFALTNGPYNKVSMIHDPNGDFALANAGKMLWEVLGLTADPMKMYDIAVTIATTYSGAGVGQVFEVRGYI